MNVIDSMLAVHPLARKLQRVARHVEHHRQRRHHHADRDHALRLPRRLARRSLGEDGNATTLETGMADGVAASYDWLNEMLASAVSRNI